MRGHLSHPHAQSREVLRHHLVAQSCDSLNDLQIDILWFLIYYKLGILSSFYTIDEDNLCLLGKICQYLKA